MQKISSLNELNIPNQYKGFLQYFLTNISSVESIDKVILFGSCARGNLQPRSDIDLFIITNKEIDIEEEFFITDDCTPPYDNEYYVPSDIIVRSSENYNKYKNEVGMLQRQIDHEGVDLSELL